MYVKVLSLYRSSLSAKWYEKTCENRFFWGSWCICIHPWQETKTKKSRRHLLEQCKGLNVNSQLGDYPKECGFLWLSRGSPHDTSMLLQPTPVKWDSGQPCSSGWIAKTDELSMSNLWPERSFPTMKLSWELSHLDSDRSVDGQGLSREPSL